MAISYNQTIAVGLDAHAVLGKSLMESLPICCRLQNGKDFISVGLGIGLKGLLACVGFPKSRLLAQCRFFIVGAAIIDYKAVFLLQLTANLVAYPVIPKLFVAGTFFRVNRIVGNVHVKIARISMDATMPLVVSIPQSSGKAFFYGFEGFGSKPGFVFWAKADNKVIGFALCSAEVRVLNGHGFSHAIFVVISPKASSTPRHKALFTLLSGVSNVIGKSGVVIIFRADTHFFADHFMRAIVVWSSRCRESSSCKRR